MMSAFLRIAVFAASVATGAQGGARPAEPPYVIDTIAERRVARLPRGQLFWRVERYADLAAAKAAAGPYALAATASRRHWLFTLGPRGRANRRATHVAEIGPIAIPAARTYLLRINRAGGPRGARTPVHTHPGSEAIYVLGGRMTQRTPHGTRQAGPGETLNAHAPEMAMQITSSGDVPLEQLVMFVVDADRPFSPPARFPE